MNVHVHIHVCNHRCQNASISLAFILVNIYTEISSVSLSRYATFGVIHDDDDDSDNHDKIYHHHQPSATEKKYAQPTDKLASGPSIPPRIYYTYVTS